MAIEFKTMLIRGGTAGQWASANPVLADREIAVEEASSPAASPRLKIGDGITPWNSLKYVDQDITDTILGKVSKTGDTMTGDLALTTGEPRLFITPDAGQPGGLTFMRGVEERWRVQMSNDAESGGNLGSYLDVVRFDDDGVILGIAMRWYRNSGVADFIGGLNIGTQPGPSADNIQVPDTAWVRDRLGELRLTATAVLDFGSLATGRAADLTVAVPGAVVGDVVTLGAPSNIPAQFVFCGFVSAADTVTVRVENAQAVTVDAPSGTWKVMVLK